jgi:hypothetical protein
LCQLHTGTVSNTVKVAEKSCFDWQEKEEIGLKKIRKSKKN